MEDFAYGGVSNPDAVLTVKDSSDEKVFLFSQVPNPKLVDNLYEFFDRIEGYSP